MLEILQQMLEDADAFGYIRAGAFIDTYDRVAQTIEPKLLKDLSISQLEAIVWDAFYQDIFNCTIGDSDELWSLDKDQAAAIIGNAERFKGIALNIRHSIFSL